MFSKDTNRLSGRYQGLASGYPDNTLRPDKTIIRAEFVSMLVKALNLTVTTHATPTFTDVAAGDWYYGAVEAAADAGLIKGYANNEFLPNAPLDRQEITAVLVQTMSKANGTAANTGATTSFTDNTKIAGWARSFVSNAGQDGLIQGYPDNPFGPLKSATRVEACVMINNFLGINK